MQTKTFHVNIGFLVEANRLLKSMDVSCLEELSICICQPCSENTVLSFLSDWQNSFTGPAQRTAISLLLAQSSIFYFSWNHKVNELISNYIVHICNPFACSPHNSSVIKAVLLLFPIHVLILECSFVLLICLCLPFLFLFLFSMWRDRFGKGHCFVNWQTTLCKPVTEVVVFCAFTTAPSPCILHSSLCIVRQLIDSWTELLHIRTAAVLGCLLKISFKSLRRL